jgi:hypothetical protein
VTGAHPQFEFLLKPRRNPIGERVRPLAEDGHGVIADILKLLPGHHVKVPAWFLLGFSVDPELIWGSTIHDGDDAISPP